MERRTQGWVLFGFAASFLAVGVPYWSIPYQAVNLPHGLPKTGLLVVASAGALLSGLGVAPFRRIVGVVGASVPAAVLARVALETQRDPTSHNLWPFEIVIALGVGFVWALAGAAAGRGAAALAARRGRRGG